MTPPPLPRRDALRLGMGGLALGAASLLVGARVAQAQPEGDAAILAAALDVEQTLAVTYATALASGLLSGSTALTIELLHEHEQQHVDALRAELEERGGRAPEPPIPEQVVGLDALESRADIARVAMRVERAAVAAYYDAVRRLEDARLLDLVASIVASEGQHLVVLRQMAGRPPVPGAFERGRV